MIPWEINHLFQLWRTNEGESKVAALRKVFMKWNKVFYRLIDINCNNNIEWLVCFNYVCFLKQLTFKLRFTCSLLSLRSQKCLICDLHFFFPPKCFTVSLFFSLIATNISGRIAWGRLSTNKESCNGKKDAASEIVMPFLPGSQL